MIREALQALHTGADNETLDLGRVSWSASFIAVAGAAAMNWWHGVTINLQELAVALGVIAGAHGGALFLKKDTEPKAKVLE